VKHSTFLDVGEDVGRRLRSINGKSDPVFGASAEPSVYFIGKLLWSKGLGSLMELLKYAEESADLPVKVDMYGGGPDQDAAEAKAEKLGLKMPFRGPLDHSEVAYTHKVCILVRASCFVLRASCFVCFCSLLLVLLTLSLSFPSRYS
jgi:digalactosyldiacylglycerol synthase